MIQIVNNLIQERTITPFPKNVNEYVGIGHFYPSINSLIQDVTVLYNGMIVKDIDFSVSWQIYLDDNIWKYRLYDGTFYVDAVSIKDYNISLDKSKVKLGYIYNLLEVLDEKGITPTGWAIPSKADWEELITYVSTIHGISESPANNWEIAEYLNSPLKTGYPVIDSMYVTSEKPRWGVNAYGKYGKNTYGFNGLPTIYPVTPSNEVVIYLTNEFAFAGGGEDIYNTYRYTLYFLQITEELVLQDAGVATYGSIRLVRTATVGEQALDDGTFCDNIEDYDGNIYNTVKIGLQVWTVQNFAVAHYNNGDDIPTLNYPDSDESLVFYGEEEIDGYLPPVGSTCFFIGQNDAVENGIYTKTEDGWIRHQIFDEDNEDIAGVLFKSTHGDTLKNSIWVLANYGDFEIGTTELYFQQIINYPISQELESIDVGTNVPNNFLLATNDYFNLVDVTEAHARVIVGSNLIPGKPYHVIKSDISDNVVVVTNASNSDVVETSFFVVLEKKDDYVIVTRMIDGSGLIFEVNSNKEVIKTSMLIDDDDTIEKENRYVELSGDDDDVAITFDHLLYKDVPYVLSLKTTGTHTIQYYDSLEADLSIEVSEGIEQMLVLNPYKYVVQVNDIVENGQLAIKIPAGFMLNNLVVFNNDEVSHIQAEGTIQVTTGTMIAEETFTIGDETFTFKTGTPTNPFEIKRLNSSGYNLSIEIMNRINADSTYVDCTRLTYGLNDSTLKITAKSTYAGVAGNAIATTETVTSGFVFGAETLLGGESLGDAAVTIDIGTTSEGDDVVDGQVTAPGGIVTIPINKVFSKIAETELYVSSADWNSARIDIYATRDEGISKTL